MKKYLIILALIAFSYKAFPQHSIGGGFCIGSEIERPGLQLKSEHEISPVLVISPYFNLFIAHKSGVPGSEVKTSLTALNGDLHYVFKIENNFHVYPLGGINLSFVRTSWEYYEYNYVIGNKLIKDRDSDFEPGLNIGGGAKYFFMENLGAYSELKYVISSFDQVVFTIGVLYSL